MITLKIGERIFFSYSWMPLVFIFLIGGGVQYIGIISSTQTNFLVIFLCTPILLYKRFWRNFNLELYLIILIVFCIFNSLYTGFVIENTFTYIYYIYCTLFAAVFGRYLCDFYINKLGVEVLEKKYILLIKVFLIIQVFVCFFQNLFVNQAIANASIPIIPEDIVSGTMYLKSDASLAAISQLIMISIFLINSKIIDKIIVSILVLSIIFLGNSKAAQAIIIFIFLALCLNLLYKKNKLGKVGFNYIFYSISFFAFIFWAYYFSGNIWDDFVSSTIESYSRRDAWVSADRLAPLGQFFYEELNVVGNGPLTYYNPNTKSWLYNSGFSTLYSLYIDLGLVGLVVYFIYYIKLILKYSSSFFVFFVFFIIFFIFTQFNLTLSDIAFAFAFNFILFLTFSRYILNKKV